MAFITVDQFVEAVEHWNILEIDQAIKAIEERFDVKPIQTVVPSTPQEVKKEEEEQATFKIFISEIGSNKIKAIMLAKRLFSWGLKEAKDRVEDTSKPLAEDLSKEEAEKIKTELETCGVTINQVKV